MLRGDANGGRTGRTIGSPASPIAACATDNSSSRPESFRFPLRKEKSLELAEDGELCLRGCFR